MNVKRYRKRPVEVEAIQWTGDNAQELIDWTNCAFHPFDFAATSQTAELWVQANKGYLAIETGEWVVKDGVGFYPCKASVFERTYEGSP